MTTMHITSARFEIDVVVPLRWVTDRDLNTGESSTEAEVLIPLPGRRWLFLQFVNGGWLSPTGQEITLCDARYGVGQDEQPGDVVKDIHYTEIGPDLGDVMTTSEAADEFGIEQITVVKNIERGNIAARKSGGTWLIRRIDAQGRWGKKPNAD